MCKHDQTCYLHCECLTLAHGVVVNPYILQNLAGLGGNDPHSSAVTVPCASMNTLDPIWYDWRDLNPQSMKRQILSLLCIPFHHSRIYLVETLRLEQRRPVARDLQSPPDTITGLSFLKNINYIAKSKHNQI